MNEQKRRLSQDLIVQSSSLNNNEKGLDLTNMTIPKTGYRQHINIAATDGFVIETPQEEAPIEHLKRPDQKKSSRTQGKKPPNTGRVVMLVPNETDEVIETNAMNIPPSDKFKSNGRRVVIVDDFKPTELTKSIDKRENQVQRRQISEEAKMGLRKALTKIGTNEPAHTSRGRSGPQIAQPISQPRHTESLANNSGYSIEPL